MSNYYKSKEVYKQHRDAVTHEPKIIPVRGLYVSGDHLEPTYIDHNVTITQCTSTSMTIVDYVDRTIDVPTDHSVNVLDFYQTDDIGFVNYTTDAIDVPTDHSVNILDFYQTDDIGFVGYISTQIDVPTDHSVNILDFYQTGSVSAIDLRTTYTDTTPQSCISVSVFTSTDLTIT